MNTANQDTVEMLAKELKEELIESAKKTLDEKREEFERTGKLLWKEDWWVDIELPKDYPEKIIEAVKHMAKVQAIWELINVYLVRTGYDSDTADGRRKLHLMELI